MLATVIVRDRFSHEVTFTTDECKKDQATEVISPLVEQWSLSDGADYTVETREQQITVRLMGGNCVRRTARGVSDTLRNALQQNGMPVCIARIRDYTEQEKHADACVGWHDGKPGAD